MLILNVKGTAGWLIVVFAFVFPSYYVLTEEVIGIT